VLFHFKPAPERKRNRNSLSIPLALNSSSGPTLRPFLQRYFAFMARFLPSLLVACRQTHRSCHCLFFLRQLFPLRTSHRPPARTSSGFSSLMGSFSFRLPVGHLLSLPAQRSPPPPIEILSFFFMSALASSCSSLLFWADADKDTRRPLADAQTAISFDFTFPPLRECARKVGRPKTPFSFGLLQVGKVCFGLGPSSPF